MLIGNGPTDLNRVSMVGNDLQLDTGVGTCGKNGQGVPVGVGQPTLRMDRITVGGTGEGQGEKAGLRSRSTWTTNPSLRLTELALTFASFSFRRCVEDCRNCTLQIGKKQRAYGMKKTKRPWTPTISS